MTFVRSPTTTNPVSGRMVNGSSPENRGSRDRSGTSTRRQAVDRARDLPGVLGSRAAAATDEIDEAVLRERAQEAARVGCLLVVETELVRKSRIRVARDVRRGHTGEALEERPHLRRAQ